MTVNQVIIYLNRIPKVIIGSLFIADILWCGFVFATNTDSQTVYVKSEVLNLRSAPSKDSKILGKLVVGEKLYIFNTERGWLNVQVNGLQGWVTQSFVTEGEPAIVKNPTMLTRNIVASTSSKSVSVNQGIPVTIIETRGSRAFVNVADSLIGWINSDALERTEISHSKYWVDSPTLNVRAAPGTNSRIIGQLNYGQKVISLSNQSHWIKIRFDHAEGWVFKSLLSKQPLSNQQFTGTETADQRRRVQYVKQHPELPDITKNTILHGKYRIGMSKEQVIASLGKPDEIHQVQDSTMVGMVRWIYYRGDATLSLNLQNGYLFACTKDFQ